MTEKYDLAVSLGATPLTTQILRDLELQIFTFPFDLILGSDFFTRMNFFLNDCKNFIEQINISEQKNTPTEGMTQYKDLKTGFIYPFDFNPQIPVENCFPSVKARYDKYAKHLRLSIKKANKILLVYIEDPTRLENEEENYSLIIDASKKLKEKYPNKEFRIIYIKNEDVDEININPITKDATMFKLNFYRSFTETSSSLIDTSALSAVLTDIELNKTWNYKKIFFYQKLYNFITNNFINKN